MPHPPNLPLMVTNIGPLFALTIFVIIASPPAQSYKYEEMWKEKGDGRKEEEHAQREK